MFITIEGVDCSGKSTMVKMLESFLDVLNLEQNILITKEPTSGESGRQALDSLLNEKSPKEQVELFIRDRKLHVENVIRPVLLNKGIVICDRFSISTLVYQIYDLKAGFSILEIKELIQQEAESRLNIKPDLTFILEVNDEVMISRLKERKRLQNEKEFDDIERLKRINRDFKIMDFSDMSKRIIRIDANRFRAEVFQDIKSYFIQYLFEMHKLAEGVVK